MRNQASAAEPSASAWASGGGQPKPEVSESATGSTLSQTPLIKPSQATIEKLKATSPEKKPRHNSEPASSVKDTDDKFSKDTGSSSKGEKSSVKKDSKPSSSRKDKERSSKKRKRKSRKRTVPGYVPKLPAGIGTSAASKKSDDDVKSSQQSSDRATERAETGGTSDVARETGEFCAAVALFLNALVTLVLIFRLRVGAFIRTSKILLPTN